MKICPKCEQQHSKKGTYCSRSCANSRVQNQETNAKRAETLRGSTKSAETIEKARISFVKTKLEQYLATPFDGLGKVNKRRRVFEEQNHVCNKCKLSEWQGVKIPLELEHKDGDHSNNARDNLEGLCPNCHALTPTWCGRNVQHPKKRSIAKL